MRPNNTLILCPVYSPYAGGGGQYFPLLASQLHNILDGKVFILTETHPKKRFIEVDGRIEIFRVLPRRDTKEGKSFIGSATSFVCTYILFIFMIPWFVIFKCTRTIHFTRYYKLPFFTLTFCLQKIFGLKVIMDVRTTSEKPKMWRKVFGVSHIIANSIAVKNQLIKYCSQKNKIKLIPNPFVPPKKIKKIKANSIIKKTFPNLNGPFLLFVGQLLKRKAIHEILNAFIILKKSKQKMSLVLIGRNMEGQKVEEKIKSIKNIFWKGPMVRRKVLAFIQGADVIIQPSRNEGIPRVSLEAFSFNKKILLPPCVPEFSKNKSFIPRKISSKEIASKLKKIINTKNKPRYNLKKHDPLISEKMLFEIYNES